jgi:hypothetical protein
MAVTVPRAMVSAAATSWGNVGAMTDSAWAAVVRSRAKVKEWGRRRDGERGKRETGRGMVVEVRRRAAAFVSGERRKRSRAA